MEPIVVLTMTRTEFDKLATGWFVSQQIGRTADVPGPCTCETCESITEMLADTMEELLLFDEMVAEMEAVEDLIDRLKSDAQMN